MLNGVMRGFSLYLGTVTCELFKYLMNSNLYYGIRLSLIDFVGEILRYHQTEKTKYGQILVFPMVSLANTLVFSDVLLSLPPTLHQTGQVTICNRLLTRPVRCTFTRLHPLILYSRLTIVGISLWYKISGTGRFSQTRFLQLASDFVR